MTNSDFDAGSEFKKQLTALIGKPLKALGFFRYKTQYFIRVSEDDMVKSIIFQKYAYGEKKYTVNMVLFPLFVNRGSLSMLLGTRIGHFKYGYDHWWRFHDADETISGFTDVRDILLHHVVPAFDALDHNQGMLDEFKANKSPVEFPVDAGWNRADA